MGKFGGHRLKNKLMYVHSYDRTFKGGIAICEGPIAYIMFVNHCSKQFMTAETDVPQRWASIYAEVMVL